MKIVLILIKADGTTARHTLDSGATILVEPSTRVRLEINDLIIDPQDPKLEQIVEEIIEETNLTLSYGGQEVKLLTLLTAESTDDGLSDKPGQLVRLSTLEDLTQPSAGQTQGLEEDQAGPNNFSTFNQTFIAALVQGVNDGTGEDESVDDMTVDRPTPGTPAFPAEGNSEANSLSIINQPLMGAFEQGAGNGEAATSSGPDSPIQGPTGTPSPAFIITAGESFDNATAQDQPEAGIENFANAVTEELTSAIVDDLTAARGEPSEGTNVPAAGAELGLQEGLDTSADSGGGSGEGLFTPEADRVDLRDFDAILEQLGLFEEDFELLLAVDGLVIDDAMAGNDVVFLPGIDDGLRTFFEGVTLTAGLVEDPLDREGGITLGEVDDLFTDDLFTDGLFTDDPFIDDLFPDATVFFEVGTFEGGSGNDTIVGGNASDTVDGGFGDDRLEGNVGDDTLFGGLDNDFLFGGADGDTLEGGEGNDNISGGQGGDILEGNVGNDILVGNTGDDILAGGLGSDTLTGGGGDDRFDFAPGDGGPTIAAADIITDFNVGTDQIGLTNGLDFAQVLTSDNGGEDAILSVAGGDVLATLLFVNPSLLTDTNFVELL